MRKGLHGASRNFRREAFTHDNGDTFCGGVLEIGGLDGELEGELDGNLGYELVRTCWHIYWTLQFYKSSARVSYRLSASYLLPIPNRRGKTDVHTSSHRNHPSHSNRLPRSRRPNIARVRQQKLTARQRILARPCPAFIRIARQLDTHLIELISFDQIR